MGDWIVVGVEPYTNGSMTSLWVWQKPCASCQAPFTVRAPALALRSKTLDAKRCEGCRDPVAVARGKARAAIAAAMNVQKKANTRNPACNTQDNARCNVAENSMQHATLRGSCNVACLPLARLLQHGGGWGTPFRGYPPPCCNGAGPLLLAV